MEPLVAIDSAGGIESIAVVDDRIYCAEKTQIRVLSLSTGASIAEFGELKNPHGVAVDNDGIIWVSDTDNGRIMCYRDDGSVVRELPLVETDDVLRGPCGIAIGDKFAYVVNRDNSKLIAFAKSDFSYRSWGVKGAGNGQMKCPEGVVLDETGNIVVADFGNHRIQVFSGSGRCVRLFGEEGFTEKQLKKPKDIAICPKTHNFAIADFGNHRVSLWSKNGEFLRIFGRRGDDPGEFKFPSAVEFSRSGDMVVCDAARLQVFGGSGIW